MRRQNFITGEIYHIYNRGVDKRIVFLDNQDRFRFIHDLFEFNDTAPAINFRYKKEIFRNDNEGQFHEVRPREIAREIEPRDLLVEILCWCLMPNHYHLLLKQKRDNGIVQFMQKLGTGYTMYFNQKHERPGVLFQGKFKSIIVSNEAHFIHLPYYIHSNPLELKISNWKEKRIKDWKKADKILKEYRWSSYLDYIGEHNFPSIICSKFLSEFWEGSENYKDNMRKWLKDFEIGNIADLTFE